MKSYKYYLDLEQKRNKIEKIVETNNVITPISLGNEWKKLPYLDPESPHTEKQHDLILKYVERLRAKAGVVAISPGFKTTYFCSYLKAEHANPYIRKGKDTVENGGFLDIIYAHEHGIVALACNHQLDSNGHDGLADSMGIPSSEDIREKYIVGGGIKFDGKKLITCEHSGHYGHLWTNELRQDICNILSAATGLEVEHKVWDKEVTFTSEEPVVKEHLKPYSVTNSSSFFSAYNKNTDRKSAIKQDDNAAENRCVLL